MKDKHKLVLAAALWLLVSARVEAFSLIGPPAAWQDNSVQMNIGADIGTPQLLDEEYRYNVPVVYYATDGSFVDYFGSRGIEEIDKAVKLINDLPPASAMSADLSEFPLDTSRLNFKAASLNLFDLKSTALQSMVEQLGLLEPTRFAWCLRLFTPDQNCAQNLIATFLIIKRNYDPVSWEPSSYVNGTLYTFRLVFAGPTICTAGDAIEEVVDPLAIPDNAVADSTFRFGRFYSGLTRDDIGGLRYIYRPSNLNRNEVMPGSVVQGGTPFSVYDPAAVPVVPPPALRAGVDKVRLEKRSYDSLLGTFFQPFTNVFQGKIVTNGTTLVEYYNRPVTRPDLVFSAADLGTVNASTPTAVTRIVIPYVTQNQGTSVAGLINGPGSIDLAATQVGIAFGKVGPTWVGQTPFLIRETQTSFVYNWGSFDGTTNEPVIYPSSASTRDLERQIFGN